MFLQLNSRKAISRTFVLGLVCSAHFAFGERQPADKEHAVTISASQVHRDEPQFVANAPLPTPEQTSFDPNTNPAFLVGMVAAVGGVAGLISFFITRRRLRSVPPQLPPILPDPLHHCRRCGKTEYSDPDLEFRVATDGEEYCSEHLPSRTVAGVS